MSFFFGLITKPTSNPDEILLSSVHRLFRV
jgi:hypothetical protein